MKVKKVGLIFSIIFSIILFVIGVYMIVLLTATTPIIVSQEITITKAEGDYFVWGGKIKNNTNSTIILTENNFQISTHTNDKYFKQYGPLIHSLGWFSTLTNEELVLKAGEEYDLDNELEFTCGDRVPDKVIQVKVILDGCVYYPVGNPDLITHIVICSVAFSLGSIILLVGILVYIYNKKSVLYFNQLTEYAKNLNSNNIVVSGFYGKPKMNGSSIIKSIASALVGALFAVFTGFTFYKIYKGKAKQYFIINEKGIYFTNPKSKELNLEKMNFHEKSKFEKVIITPVKWAIVLTANGEDYIFYTKHSGIEQQVVLGALEKLTY